MTLALACLAEVLKTPPPWLLPYAPVARRVLEAEQSDSVADALNAAVAHGVDGLRFVEHEALPAGEPYEAFIARTASIPTRDNMHDLFNGLMWLSYPKTKRRLNVLQADEIERRGHCGARGSLRDALTLFDENAAILHAPASVVDALSQRRWQALFVERRGQWQSARLMLFGHALLEKLMQPRKAITAHVWVIEGSMDSAASIDDALASSLDPERLAAKDFLPLPVLGVPGWWPANETAEFYADADVFRPRRR